MSATQTLSEQIAEQERLIGFWKDRQHGARIGAMELTFNWDNSMNERLDELERLINKRRAHNV